MLYIGPISSIFDIATFAIMWFVFKANTIELQPLFQSGWFVVGLVSQNPNSPYDKDKEDSICTKQGFYSPNDNDSLNNKSRNNNSIY